MMYPNEFAKVFGNIGNGSKTVGYTNSDRKTSVVMREGKTARDKANGHQPYRKNRRIWEDGGSGKNGAPGKWTKV